MVTSDFIPEVEIRPFRACTMHQAIIIGTVRSLWTWLWGRYHVPQNAFLVCHIFTALHRMLTRSSNENSVRQPSVRPSVCLSVKRVNCDKTEEKSVQIFIPHERPYSVIFWKKEWLVGGEPST